MLVEHFSDTEGTIRIFPRRALSISRFKLPAIWSNVFCAAGANSALSDSGDSEIPPVSPDLWIVPFILIVKLPSYQRSKKLKPAGSLCSNIGISNAGHATGLALCEASE